MNKFLNSEDLQLLNGGYLSDKAGNPVNHNKFVELQKSAEYLVTFAAVAKGKNFKEQKSVSSEELKAAVAKILAKKDIQFLDTKPVTSGKITSQLREEAVKFMQGADENQKIGKINKFLQQYELLQDFENFGLFFEDGIVKLNEIYSIADIIEAVTETIDLLD